MSRALIALWVAAVSVPAIACGSAVPLPAKPPSVDRVGQTSCHAVTSQLRPLVVEWSASDRADLERASRLGVVAVRYDGCEMEVLRDCRLKASYAYTALTPKHDHLAVKDENDLYANLPLGAAKLEAKLAQAGSLDVSMTVVGTLDASVESASREDLTGACSGATHIVAGITVGAFDFFAGAQTEAHGGVTAPIASASAAATTARETLSSDGDQQACGHATRADQAPPEGCSAIVRLEVVPLGAKRVVTPLPEIDLGEITYVPPVYKPNASIDLAVLVPPDGVVTSSIDPASVATWHGVTDSRKALRDEQVERANLEQKRNDCVRDGCPDEAKLNAALKAADARVTAAHKRVEARMVAAAHTLAVTAEHNPSAGGLFVAGLVRRMLAQSLDDDRAMTDGNKVAADLFERASKVADKDSAIMWWALYELGEVRDEASDAAGALKAFHDLLALPTRPGTAEVAWRVGNLETSPDAAVVAYERALQDVRGTSAAVLRPVVLYALVTTQFQRGHYAESLQNVLALNDTLDEQRKNGNFEVNVYGELTGYGASCVEKLGGVEREPLRAATPAAVARIGMEVARLALGRDDLASAARAWDLVAKRAGDSLDAPAAWGALASARDELGDEDGARDARAKLAAYAFTSPWAAALRASRDPRGAPTDDDIRGGLSAPPPRLPARPTTDEGRRADVRSRLFRALRACNDGNNGQPATLHVSVAVVEGRAAQVTAEGDASDLATCMKGEAPAYFSGAASSVKAVVHVIQQ
jgi:hypothetical protein